MADQTGQFNPDNSVLGEVLPLPKELTPRTWFKNTFNVDPRGAIKPLHNFRKILGLTTREEDAAEALMQFAEPIYLQEVQKYREPFLQKMAAQQLAPTFEDVASQSGGQLPSWLQPTSQQITPINREARPNELPSILNRGLLSLAPTPDEIGMLAARNSEFLPLKAEAINPLAKLNPQQFARQQSELEGKTVDPSNPYAPVPTHLQASREAPIEVQPGNTLMTKQGKTIATVAPKPAKENEEFKKFTSALEAANINPSSPEGVAEYKKWVEKMTTHPPSQTVNVNTQLEASQEAQKKFMDSTRVTFDQLKHAPVLLANIEKAKALIPKAKGFMGTGGETLLEAAKFLNNRMGMSINISGIKNAEELRSRIFFNIMDNLKKMDAQPSQMQQMIMQDALGKLGTDPNALAAVLDAYADTVRGKVDLFNTEVEGAEKRGVKFPYNPRIKVLGGSLPQIIKGAKPK